MNTDLPINRDMAKLLPQSTFTSPNRIVTDDRLTLGEKLTTLKRWAEQVKGQLAASNEGMPTNGTSAFDLQLLDDINEAITELDTSDQPEGA